MLEWKRMSKVRKWSQESVWYIRCYHQSLLRVCGQQHPCDKEAPAEGLQPQVPPPARGTGEPGGCCSQQCTPLLCQGQQLPHRHQSRRSSLALQSPCTATPGRALLLLPQAYRSLCVNLEVALVKTMLFLFLELSRYGHHLRTILNRVHMCLLCTRDVFLEFNMVVLETLQILCTN